MVDAAEVKDSSAVGATRARWHPGGYAEVVVQSNHPQSTPYPLPLPSLLSHFLSSRLPFQMIYKTDNQEREDQWRTSSVHLETVQYWAEILACKF